MRKLFELGGHCLTAGSGNLNWGLETILFDTICREVLGGKDDIGNPYYWTNFSIFPISIRRCVGFLLCKRSKSTIYKDSILQVSESIWNFADYLRWKYYQNSHILQMDLPCSHPCIRNLHDQTLCPEVIACIIVHWFFCTLQLAFSPQESCRHFSFTPTGGGVLSVSVEYFSIKLWWFGWENENVYSILFKKKKQDHVI